MRVSSQESCCVLHTFEDTPAAHQATSRYIMHKIFIFNSAVLTAYKEL